MGAGLNLINKDFLPLVWKDSIKWIKPPQLRTVNCEMVKKGGLVSLFVRMGYLRVRPWSGIVENLAVDILGPSFIDRCIRRIFARKHKIFSWNSKPVAIISMKTAINLIKADTTVFNDNNHSQDDASSDDSNLCPVVRQIIIPAYVQTAELVSFQGAGLITTDTHRNNVEHRCSLTARCLVDILPRKRFYVYMANLTANWSTYRRS